MKTITATSERSEKRPSPHTPWPLVQPPPMRVPKPTEQAAAAPQRGRAFAHRPGRDERMPGKSPAGNQPRDDSTRQLRSPGGEALIAPNRRANAVIPASGPLAASKPNAREGR